MHSPVTPASPRLSGESRTTRGLASRVDSHPAKVAASEAREERAPGCVLRGGRGGRAEVAGPCTGAGLPG